MLQGMLPKLRAPPAIHAFEPIEFNRIRALVSPASQTPAAKSGLNRMLICTGMHHSSGACLLLEVVVFAMQ